MALSDRHVSIIVNDTTHDLFMLKTEAKRLHTAKLLQKIEGRAAYCARRSWRQIAAGHWSPLPSAVLDHCALTPLELHSTPPTQQGKA